MTAVPVGLLAPPRTVAPLAPVVRGPIERLVLAAGRWAERPEVDALLRVALKDLGLGLCLHRVSVDGPFDWLTVPAGELDALVELLLSTRPREGRPWLTVAFDDGYDDAAWYVETRAPRFPDVEWLVFVCPRKTEHRLGFSWDGEQGGAQLASLERLRALQQLPNVSLGNHTNSHVQQLTMSDDEADAEYRESFGDFDRLFGQCEHFAFPFGTPYATFGPGHVTKLRNLGVGTVWSTERRPYRFAERVPGALLPRFPIDGTWTHRQSALWLALLALKFRWLGTPFRW